MQPGQPGCRASTGDSNRRLSSSSFFLFCDRSAGRILRDEQDPVEVIDLVLEDAREEVLGLELDPLAVEVERRHPDLLGPEHVAVDPREREAALLAPLASRLLRDLGVHQDAAALSRGPAARPAAGRPSPPAGAASPMPFSRAMSGIISCAFRRISSSTCTIVAARAEEDRIRVVDDLQADLPPGPVVVSAGPG